jgi:hypothetical protein
MPKTPKTPQTAKPRARSQAAKSLQSAEIAARTLAGQTQHQIADEMGISRQWANKLTKLSETQQILATMVQERLGELGALFDGALRAIGRAYRAKAFNKLGVAVGPDHYARLAAVARLTAILTAGRPMPKPPEEKAAAERTVTLAELQRILQERQRPQ